MNEYKEHKIDVNGSIVNYVQKGKGQPMLFLHNGGGFWQTWIKQLDYFSAGYNVFGIDWPGFGESSAATEPISLNLLTETLTAFIQKLGLDDIILVGNCIGGSAALNYYIHNRSVVDKLIILNICPGKLIFPNKLTAMFFNKLNDHPGLKNISSTILKYIITKTFVKKNFPAILFGIRYNKADSLYQKYVEKHKEQKQISSRINLLFAVHSYTVGGILKGTEPFRNLLIWGNENKVTSLKAHFYYHKNLLNPEYAEIIPAGGHLCMYEQPELVNSIILNYLNLE